MVKVKGRNKGIVWGGGVKGLPKKSEKMAELRFAC